MQIRTKAITGIALYLAVTLMVTTAFNSYETSYISHPGRPQLDYSSVWPHSYKESSLSNAEKDLKKAFELTVYNRNEDALVRRIQVVPPTPEPTVIVASEAAPPIIPTVAAVAVTPVPLTASIVDADSIYDIVASYFPEQPEAAWNRVLCESGGNPAAINPNGHYGLWQFALPTWEFVGGVGLPTQASAEEQTMRARILYDMSGWQPWEC